jgi:hypothetical protein
VRNEFKKRSNYRFAEKPILLDRSAVFFFLRFANYAQQTPVTASNSRASPSPTPIVFSPQTLADLKGLQQAALSSDYAYKQVAHLANNIGPRLSGSAQAAKRLITSRTN